jgi:hypothetical protein
VTGTLAATLSGMSQFPFLPRDANRSMLMKSVLAQRALPIGLSPLFQGRGLARTA